MADILLLPFGSAGDVFPFIWLGRQLLAHGHRVRLVTFCAFEDHARNAGLEFVPVGKKNDFEDAIRDPRIWKNGIGTKVVFESAAYSVELYLTAIESCGRVDLLLGAATAFAARLAREKLSTPLITVHTMPAMLMSAYETPVLNPAMRLFNKLPLSLKKWILALPNPVDLVVLPSVSRICAANGVKPPRSLWRQWWNSPDGVLVLLPEWFSPPQPDWPPNLLQWSFPLEDLSTEHSLPRELQEFLAHGDRPVVFAPGSANVHAARFFAVAAEAVQRIGCRAVFASRDPEQVPPELPSSILTVEYAPFSLLLQHTAVFVHHGGIGTTSQGLAAGVPQLIMAMTHDQPDNAARLERLGAGTGLSVRQFTPARVAHELKQLLHGVEVRQAALKYAAILRQRPNLENMLDWIESRLKSRTHQI
jgi:rhamnosyltransferase subunit B